MANSHYLPPEILLEIFSYLPTKSIGKFRCLSKTWNTNLSNSHSQFINLHLTRKTHNQENLIVISTSGFLHVTTPSIKNIIDKYSYPISTCIIQLGDGWTKLLGSCNGLVFLRNYYDNKNTFVVNPVTRQQVQIPEPPSILTGDENRTMYGFGYDRSCEDFKVVALSPQSTYYKKYNVDVYSMKKCVWKHVGYCPYACYAEPFMPFVNGAMHWLSRVGFGCGYHIGAFDLATESFPEIFLPKGFEKSNIIDIAVFQGCLAIVDCYWSAWVMKEQRVVDSPVRLHIDKKVSWTCMVNWSFKPVAVVGDEEKICFNTNWGGLVLHDLKRLTEHVVFARETRGSFLDSIVFEESIVSPEQESNGLNIDRKIASRLCHVPVLAREIEHELCLR